MILETLQQLPLRSATQLVLALRNRFATTPWPEDVPSVTTAYSTDQADALLQDAHWEDASAYSLKYRGEILNLRRPAGLSPEGVPLEAHLRARQDPDTLSLEWVGHVEASRFNAKEAHVAQDGLVWLDEAELRGVLLEAGLETTTPDDSS